MHTILAIESSCDETSASVVSDGKIRSNIIATQDIHKQYGGVVPELASRAHEKNIVPVVQQALEKANITKQQLDAVAFTQGPGLLGALLIGNCFAKGMAMALNIPLIGVNHMEAHINAHFIAENKPEFPFLCLTVSGGHTQIVLVTDFGKFEILGETIDDAVGEAFDKTAKLLNLPYPGGPLIDKMAKNGNSKAFIFSIPEVPDFNFSFSGIKTSILYFIQKNTVQNPDFISENLADICASVQFTLVEILMRKLKKAAKQFHIKTIAIAGGVAANSELRKRIIEESEKNDWKYFIPDFEYCTDNAAMIAISAYYKYNNKDFVWLDAVPNARMAIGT
ncbi:MAG: tRNA (adenosine(37)-N6)-threonylcarbamoyltransferase complex transferase subunit TsaD [Bacteroidetes bacterium]|nr:MAG: tRNA (adenosine(37)-N6)-threonylcarbamoyltransferase complex transferase subunit TsaD [Bacteroidota bacterium]